jgi:hypothetical protein
LLYCESPFWENTELTIRPQYWEIYKLKEVVGISLVFMAVDIGGGVFSFLSLFFRPKLDYAAFVSINLDVRQIWLISQVSYALVVLLDGIVVILAFILNPIAKRRRAREAAETGHVVDDPETNGAAGEMTGVASPLAIHHKKAVVESGST